MLIAVNASVRTAGVRDKYGDDLHLLLMKYYCKNHYKRKEEKIHIGKRFIDYVGALYAQGKHG